MPSVDVPGLITSLNPIRQTSSYRMPVLSPRHTSSSTLTGSYRSTFSSSSVDRPYYGSSNSYSSPRINTYSERFSTRTYSTDDGKKIYSRHASITEDGITTRYREDSREKSSRRESLSRDSGYRDSSTRSNSLRDSSLARERDLSLSRESRNNLSTLSMIESVADLRNKYSPANYVPAVLRKQDNISRSKSINDIGRPPFERSDPGKTQITKTKKVNTENGLNSNSVALANPTNDKLDNNGLSNDSNGNRASVAEIRKKFDPNYSRKSNGLCVEGTGLVKSDPTRLKPGKSSDNNLKSSTNEGTTINEKRERTQHKQTKSDNHNNTDLLVGGSIKCYNRPAKCFKINDLEIQAEKSEETTTKLQESESGDAVSSWAEEPGTMDVGDAPRPHNHTTNFASYIPSKDFPQGEAPNDREVPMNETEDLEMENNENCVGNFGYQQHRPVNANNDISTSPRLNRSALSQNASGSSSQSTSLSTLGSTQRSSPSPSLERERPRDEDRSSYGSGAAGGSVKNHGLNGLKNIGNTCFMNSVIQCLSNTRYLLEYVREDGYHGDINTSISSMKGALIKAFSQVIQELWSPDSSDRVVNTVALKSQIQRFAPRFMGYAQQDAQEFLRYLLEGLHEDVNRVTSKPAPILTEIDEKLSDAQKASESWQRYLRMDNSRVVDIFVGQLKSTLRCTHCGHCSVTFDPFWDLSLPIPQRQGPLRLGQCLEHFTREETLDGDEKPTCAKCKERRKCTKSFSIQKFPKILVIHLKRFSPTERFRGKLSLVIDFPLQGLDLSQYAAAKGQTECLYNLYAISNHSGTTYSGHYTAYCKHPYTSQWHEYNDSRVSSISPKNVVSSEAYVLFYELVGQHAHL